MYRYALENLNNFHASSSDLVFLNVNDRNTKYPDKIIPEVRKMIPTFPFTKIITLKSKRIRVYAKM